MRSLMRISTVLFLFEYGMDGWLDGNVWGNKMLGDTRWFVVKNFNFPILFLIRSK